MKSFLKVGFLTLAVLCSGNLIAQENDQTNSEPNSNLSNFYDAELFHWSYNMWRGLSLNYLNQSSSTAFSINKSMQNALLQYPDSGQEYRSYRWKSIVGNVFLWGGLALAYSAFIPLYSGTDMSNNDVFDRNEKIALGLSCSGLASVIVGSFFSTSGQENIYNAVNIFNRNKIREYRQ